MREDANHERSKSLMQELADKQAHILFPITAICEATTTLQRKMNNPTGAQQVMEQLQSDTFPVLAVTQEALHIAASLFKPHGSKQNTLFDALVAASARLHNADAIFSFDEWYRKLGFTLVEDFISAEKAA